MARARDRLELLGQGDDFDLDPRTAGQRGDGDRRAGRRGVGEILAVDRVDGREVADIDKEDRRLDDVRKGCRGGGQHGFDVLHDLARLRGYVAGYDLARNGIQRYLPAAEDEVAAANSLIVWTDWGGRVRRKDFFKHGLFYPPAAAAASCGHGKARRLAIGTLALLCMLQALAAPVLAADPSLSIANTASQTLAPGQTVSDGFTVTNSGSGTGAITLNAPTQTGAATLAGTYVLGNAATGTCSAATPCSLSTLNAQPALATAAAGATIAIGAIYRAAVNATTPGTVTTTLTGSIQQASDGTISPTASATDIDSIRADARLDLQKTASQPGATAAPITYTISGNNGGSFAARALVSAGNLLGLTNTAGVIAVLDAVPHYSGATAQAALTAAPAVGPLPAGDAGSVYYSTSIDGLSGWSTTFNAAANYVALFVTTTNAGGIVFPSNPVAGEGAGNVPAATAQFSLAFSTTQPVGPGAANPGSLSNIANSIAGGNPGAAGTPIIAPGIAVGSDYETASVTFPAGTFGPTAANTTPGTNPPFPPGGASNIVTSQAFAQGSVLNGPIDNAGATGSHDGAVAVSNQNDFTDVSFACGGASSGAPLCIWPAGGVAIPQTLQNTGNASDTFNIFAAAPAGFTVQLFAAAGCPASATTVLPIAPYSSGGCTIGAAISPPSGSGSSVTTTVGSAVGSNATLNYIVVYQSATGSSPPFTPVTGFTIAYGSAVALSGGVPVLGPDANETYDTIYPAGSVKLTKTQAIVSNCSGTPAPGAVCPGGTITYTLSYANVAPAALASGGSGLGTEPAFATNAINVTVGGAVLADDGTIAGGWAANTFGIDAAPAPSSTTAGTVFTYTPSVPLSSGAYPNAKTQGPTKISAQIGGSTGLLGPGTSGNVVFQVTVR